MSGHISGAGSFISSYRSERRRGSLYIPPVKRLARPRDAAVAVVVQDQPALQPGRGGRPRRARVGDEPGARPALDELAVGAQAQLEAPVEGVGEGVGEGGHDGELLAVVAAVVAGVAQHAGRPSGPRAPPPHVLGLVPREGLVVGADGLVEAVEGALEGVAPAPGGDEAGLVDVRVVLVHVGLAGVGHDVAGPGREAAGEEAREAEEEEEKAEEGVVGDAGEEAVGVAQLEGRVVEFHLPAPLAPLGREVEAHAGDERESKSESERETARARGRWCVTAVTGSAGEPSEGIEARRSGAKGVHQLFDIIGCRKKRVERVSKHKRTEEKTDCVIRGGGKGGQESAV
ncbi:unnamed protein product [Clonostachys solani]|uniref:Uncharacterized protein n=1 Tax=Clonostachys solani TaxID=160281 RepID=A0A9N9Z1Z6_9HYPO|nr:unnamed protein product [Clonostachys solani]